MASALSMNIASAKVTMRPLAAARRVTLRAPAVRVSAVARIAKPAAATRGKALRSAGNPGLTTYTKEEDIDAEFRALQEKAMVAEVVSNAGLAEDGSGPPHKVTPKVVDTVANDAVGASKNLGAVFIKSILAGVFIGLGGTLCSSVGGDVPALMGANPGLQRALFGALGFPLAIFLVTTLGATAMTGTIVMAACACFTDRMNTGTAAKLLTVAWVGNAVGLLGMAALAAAGNMDAVIPCVAISLHKAAASWWQVFFRGVGGGVLICSAIMQAYAARNGVEKLLGIWFCISTYVMCGWEHGLANLFFFPCAIFGGSPEVTWGMFIDKNLIPSTLGNIAGGCLLGAAMVMIHLATNSKLPKISLTFEK